MTIRKKGAQIDDEERGSSFVILREPLLCHPEGAKRLKDLERSERRSPEILRYAQNGNGGKRSE